MHQSIKKHLAVILTVMMTLFMFPVSSFASSTADDIKYETDEGDEIDFDADDFEDACDDATNEDLKYIKFDDLPSSSKGTLYYEYEGSDEEKVDEDTKYYSGEDPDLDDVSFVPKKDYSGRVTIGYSGKDTDGNSFSGDIVITVNESSDSSDGDIDYSVDAEDELNFDEDDFNDYCQDENDEDLDYIKFTLPSSSKGVLYYDFDGDDEEKISSSTKYYYDKDPSIDDITFIPNDDYAGTCKVSFEGYDEEGDSIEGTVAIKVSNEDREADTIYLSGAAGAPITMYDQYFNKNCKEALDNTLDYVKFTLPSSSYGTLYYSYTSAGNYSSLATSSTKYYYDDSPNLSKVSFVSAGSNAGTYTIKYTGYDTDGDSFTGDVNITVTERAGSSSSSSGSNYFCDLNGNYAWAAAYVDTLYSTAVVTGEASADGTKHFNPGSNVTRGDFMLLLCRALNLSTAANGNFSDVPSGSYYYDALATAKALGIAQGTNNRFYPNQTITREDAMVLTQRAMNISGNSAGVGALSDLAAYLDHASVSTYAQDAVAALIKAGIITGSSDSQLHPKSNITRAEAAAIIYRIKY